MAEQAVPVFWQYMAPIVEALRTLGGTATIRDLEERVPVLMGLSAVQTGQLHDPERGDQTEVAYRMAWARTYLRKCGLIENRARGEWALTEQGLRAPSVDGQAIAQRVRSSYAEDEEDELPATPEGPTETYLLAWNPNSFPWEELDAVIAGIRANATVEQSWSCGRVKNIAPGSRFFLIRLASEPRGIIGTGTILDAPRQEAHWDAERAAEGATTNFVDIRFDHLSRSPVITRDELNAPGLDGFKWDTQMSGVHVPKEKADALARMWRSRVTGAGAALDAAPTESGTTARWHAYWADAEADSEWTEMHRLRDAKRREVLPRMRELIEGFIAERVTFPELRETFDRKTRGEWDWFGFKGMSGGMFLNRLALHLPDTGATATALRIALAVPGDDAEARRKLDAFMSFLEAQIDVGTVSKGDLQPNRAPFFLSACWHVQQPEVWPIIYQSSCQALEADGLLGRSLRRGDGYLEFCRVFRGLARALGVSFWDLEHLCVRLQAEPSVSAETQLELEAASERAEDVQRIWLIAPGARASRWDDFYEHGIIAIGWREPGDLRQYSDLDGVRRALRKGRTNHDPTNDALACYEFAHEMKVGDLVFAKRGTTHIIGYGVITSEYEYRPDQEYPHIRRVEWKKRGEWAPRARPLVTKTLTEIGGYAGLIADIRRALGLDDAKAEPVPEPPLPRYDLDIAAEEVFASRERLADIVELLRHKKNVVLQGPPGVGKTFFAKRLAFLLLGVKDPKRVELVQFHQSYSYEDFVQGYRPKEGGGFERRDGLFLDFCDLALQDPSAPYVLIVDEINRGNLSKIFGELLMLIESDKRSEAWKTRLAYGHDDEQRFFVPENLHIIGTMNTADRSLAMVDYALRRRFAFVDIEPAFDQPLFAQTLTSGLGVEPALRSRLISRMRKLNESIRNDPNLGEGFCLGHSYFCQRAKDAAADEAWYKRIVRTEIAPLLREYWDARDRVDQEVAHLLDDD